jgi:hypothetical protein
MTTNKRESRHSPNLTILIAVIFLVVFNHFHCGITDPEPVDEKKFFSVTGTLYEVTEECIRPGTDAVQHITIRATKPERTEVDTVLPDVVEYRIRLQIMFT